MNGNHATSKEIIAIGHKVNSWLSFPVPRFSPFSRPSYFFLDQNGKTAVEVPVLIGGGCSCELFSPVVLPLFNSVLISMACGSSIFMSKLRKK